MGWDLESLHIPLITTRHDEITRILNPNSNSTDYCTVNSGIFAKLRMCEVS